jgi:site-specific DNA-methyltransferase (adenine-specific)
VNLPALATADTFRNQIVEVDALALCRSLPPASVDLILTDPPYHRVADTAWDKQWASAADFLAWLETIVIQFKRILKPNGSLYLFASPQMSARVEVMIGQHLNVLNNIRWVKDEGWHKKAQKEALRSYLSSWEAVIFAEQPNSDNIALADSHYEAALDNLRGFVFEPIRAYLAGEFKRAGVPFLMANEFCGTANMAARHYFAKSQWCMPTPEHYASLQRGLNSANCRSDYLRREYEDLRREYDYLRREYDYLRREYDYLRREYEDLRRPFYATSDAPHFDIWNFNSVPTHKARHEAQKPVALIRHIIQMSSKPGALVLDPFAGSGTTAVACKITGRDYICGDTSAEYVELARRRVTPEFGKAPKRIREPEPMEAREVAPGIVQNVLFSDAASSTQS